eukprot:3424150-Amphidinium_carterae.1
MHTLVPSPPPFVLSRVEAFKTESIDNGKGGLALLEFWPVDHAGDCRLHDTMYMQAVPHVVRARKCLQVFRPPIKSSTTAQHQTQSPFLPHQRSKRDKDLGEL